MIEVKDVYFKYNKESRALNGVNITVPDGKWISIIGHNGSGKSTLAKLLCLLMEPEKGQILMDGEPYSELGADYVHQHLGIVFQNPDNQFVGVTVYKDVAFALENRNMPRALMVERIDNALDKVKLSKYKDREPYKLSGGQKQRVAIAGIIASDLKYVIFDEATSMLDPEGSRDVINVIRELKEKENKTIITITHDLSLAAQSDYIYVLKEGTVSYEGVPQDVLKQEEILEQSNLESPFNLKLYHEVMKDSSLSEDEELTDILWQLSLKM